MKKVMKIFAAVMMAAMLTACLCLPAMAAEGYTYTVTVSTGGMEGAVVDPGAVAGAVKASDEKLVISGLSYGESVNLTGAVALADDSRYYVRTFVLSGQDSDESAVMTAVPVTGDMDFVPVYGVKGEQTEYTVNYVDTAGEPLAESQTFMGTIGDKPVATFVYIEGYLPQAMNLTKTLTGDPAEDVFTFVYYELVTEVIITEEGGAVATEEAAAAAAEAGLVELPDGEVPLADVPLEQPLEDLDDNEIPLASGTKGGVSDTFAGIFDESGRKGAVIGGSIAGAVVLIGIATAVILKKKKA